MDAGRFAEVQSKVAQWVFDASEGGRLVSHPYVLATLQQQGYQVPIGWACGAANADYSTTQREFAESVYRHLGTSSDTDG